jgi:hypothetical protein
VLAGNDKAASAPSGADPESGAFDAPAAAAEVEPDAMSGAFDREVTMAAMRAAVSRALDAAATAAEEVAPPIMSGAFDALREAAKVTQAAL